MTCRDTYWPLHARRRMRRCIWLLCLLPMPGWAGVQEDQQEQQESAATAQAAQQEQQEPVATAQATQQEPQEPAATAQAAQQEQQEPAASTQAAQQEQQESAATAQAAQQEQQEPVATAQATQQEQQESAATAQAAQQEQQEPVATAQATQQEPQEPAATAQAAQQEQQEPAASTQAAQQEQQESAATAQAAQQEQQEFAATAQATQQEQQESAATAQATQQEQQEPVASAQQSQQQAQQQTAQAQQEPVATAQAAQQTLTSIGTDTMIISDIRVLGLQRVSAGTVLNLLDLDTGDAFDEYAGRAVIRKLFASGYFNDVRIGRDGDVLIISVAERPAIESIDIEGNKSIETDALMVGLSDSGLAPGEVFRRSTLERVGLELERQYVSQGRYSAAIATEAVDMPRNRVGIRIEIEEGLVARVRHINIVGNTIYSDRQLLELFELQLTGLLSFYSKDDLYSREKLAGDLERLEARYKDSGYVNFRVDSTQVTVNADRTEVYITINIDEGSKYSVRDVTLAGELHDVSADALESLLLVTSGQTYSQALVTATEERITGLLSNAGFTFANVKGVPSVNEDDETVDLRFYIDTGKRAYVRRISFQGNTVTRDSVLRREMRQFEGGWASTSQIDLSKARLERLSYFKSVEVETPAVPGVEDQIDVEFTVQEQPSGSISATVGYSQGYGLVLSASYEENNIFGTGNSTDLSVQWSEYQRGMNFRFYDPYFTVDGISRGFDIFTRTTNYNSLSITSYTTDAFGAGVSFGYPLNETQRISFGGNAEYTALQQGSYEQIQEIIDFLASEGDEFLNLTLNTGWTQSLLNRGLFPTRGYSQALNAELTLPGSSLQFYRMTYEGQRFFPLPSVFTARINGRFSFGDGYGSTGRLPFYKHLYAGGVGSVRGYEISSLGPKSTYIGPRAGRRLQSFGGNLLAVGSLELLFPMPVVEDKSQFRPVLFLDAGNVFNTDCPAMATSCIEPDFGEIRMSVGAGITWLTALGPMSFVLSKAINDKAGDEVESFQFELGRTL